ncbi:hypothetical protein CBE89_12970 [Corynebacterium striatum]|uniref:Uncharacterized protein n=1 Tax=Corynebacterium striatum TaxID=43770 RepID=A0A2Z2IZS3_CORST|nr:hypothetical protein [Corynebacterium striatum]ART22290.1 hypothetical protein CBE89_12970 [Corynebacterium striatum]
MTFGSPRGNQQFGYPPQVGQGNQGFGAPAGSFSDYRFGQVAEQGQVKRRAADMSAWRAPWALQIAVLIVLGISSYIVYYVFKLVASERVPESLNRIERLATELGVVLSIVVVALCALSVYVLHAQHKARIWLSAVLALVVLMIVLPHVWPISLAAIVAIVLLWLPSNKEWFGFMS